MCGYTADDVLEWLWNDSADEEDIFGNEFDGESDEDYRNKSGPHRGEKMACSKRVKAETFKNSWPGFFPVVASMHCVSVKLAGNNMYNYWGNPLVHGPYFQL